MTLSQRCARALPVGLAICLIGMSAACGRNLVEFPLDGGPSATVATQAGSVQAGNVLAPDYAIDFENLRLVKNVENVVQSESGYAELVPGSALGQDYALYLGELSVTSTLAEVEAAFDTASTAGSLSDLTALQLPSEWFELVGVVLDPAVPRTVIIRNTEQSVSSYQLLVVRFD